MHILTLGEIADVLGSEIADSDRSIEISSISRNTKAISRGALFVPLKGARADGHTYIPDAVNAGAVAALCSRDDITAAVPLLRVDDTLKATQRLAAYYRTKLAKPVIGITGSVGKTTTAAMLISVLSPHVRVASTPAEDNGQVGLTFSVFRMEDSDDCAVWEMGMSQYGELSRLTHMVHPDIAIINGIGIAHIEFFGSRENILKAKLEILEGLKPGAPLILNGDDDLLCKLDLPFNILRYSLENPAAEIYGEILSSDTDSMTLRIHYKGASYERILPTIGRHNASNALAAFGAAAAYGIPPEKISFENFSNVGGRQKIVRRNGMTVMEDWYNASPEAVTASLGVLKNLAASGGKRFAALGCMRELGDHSSEQHIRCGMTAAECADYLFVYGEGSEFYLEGARKTGMPENRMKLYTSREELAADLFRLASPGDAFLFKGSHFFTHMELCMQEFYRLLDARA